MKKSSLLLCLSLFAFMASGAGKYTPSTMLFLDALKTQNEALLSHSVMKKNANGVKCVDMFIETTDDTTVRELESMGVTIGVDMKGILTASVPVDQIENIATLDGVKRLSVAQQYKLLNDKARISVGTDNVQAGTNLPQAYNGEGVIYGTLDMGFDFNHIAFKNEDNTSRLLYAYMTNKTNGTKVTGNVYDWNGNITEGGTFPGSEFDSSKISTLTTDNSSESHGTHTMGIGAGGYKGNEYYGMAPKADIIACSASNYTDVELINSISYVFGKAEKLNQPAVMNLSLGRNVGAHDGSEYFCRFADGLAGAGKIIVISAGNEGSDYLHVSKELKTKEDTLKFVLASDGVYGDIDYKSFGSYSQFDVWSKGNTDYTLNVIIYDKAKNKIVYKSNDLKGSGYSLTLNSSTKDFNSYFTGVIKLNADHSNNRYNILGSINGDVKTTYYRIGIMVTSSTGAEIDAYGSSIIFGQENISGFTKGDSDKSINTLATGKNTISVGAYSSRNTGPSINGGSNNYSSYFTVGDLAYFSSYGPDDNGNYKPEVCAPGAFVISAINSYDSSYASTGYYRSYLSEANTINKREQRYGLMSGTSMSSPCCAGVIATWLQANPYLTTNDVKAIINKTSTVDSYVTAVGESKWGVGKLNAYEGLKEALKTSSVDNATNNRNVPLLVYPNPSNGEFEVTIPNEMEDVSLKVIGMNGSLVAEQVYSLNNGKTINVNLSSVLTSGIYILQVCGNNTMYTTRLVIK